MEPNKILSADILDIIFEGRNKEYGAYDLRKTYNKRMIIALISIASLMLLLFVGYVLAGVINSGAKKQAMVVQDVQLEDVKEEKKNEPPPPPPPKVEPPKVEMAKFTPPKIVKDEQVKEEEKPPEQEKLEDTKIGTVNQEGVKDEGLAVPVDQGKGVVEAPKKDEEDYDKTFTKVEIESDYPGGQAQWARYLGKNLHYPDEAINNESQGTVIVQFIVDKEGTLSDVQAVGGTTNDQSLKDEAVRVIKKSGQWTPAVQNGRKVKSYKKQPIVFKLDQQ
jgi:protein TonB